MYIYTKDITDNIIFFFYLSLNYRRNMADHMHSIVG